MDQLVAVVREFKKLVLSIPVIQQLMPFSYILMFGGLITLAVNSVLLHWSIIFAIGHYAFFLGAWLTLASGQYKLFPYALWAYALWVLYPFNHLSVYEVTETVLYILLGAGVLRFDAYLANRQISI